MCAHKNGFCARIRDKSTNGTDFLRGARSVLAPRGQVQHSAHFFLHFIRVLPSRTAVMPPRTEPAVVSTSRKSVSISLLAVPTPDSAVELRAKRARTSSEARANFGRSACALRTKFDGHVGCGKGLRLYENGWAASANALLRTINAFLSGTTVWLRRKHGDRGLGVSLYGSNKKYGAKRVLHHTFIVSSDDVILCQATCTWRLPWLQVPTIRGPSSLRFGCRNTVCRR